MHVFKKNKFILIFLVISLNLFSLEKRTTPQNFKTSIIIPCHYKHAYLLMDLLYAYANQDVLPDEVIVSLSDTNKIDNLIVKNITNTNWPFKLQLIKNDFLVSAGENRNKACQAANGDILICQDADDLPHFQRVEIIKYFFENYHLDHLAHEFTDDKEALSINLDITKIKLITPLSFKSFKNINFAHGTIAISKKVFKTVQWDHSFEIDEDVVFNLAVYSKFRNKVILKIPLYLYRSYLSSHEAF